MKKRKHVYRANKIPGNNNKPGKISKIMSKKLNAKKVDKQKFIISKVKSKRAFVRVLERMGFKVKIFNYKNMFASRGTGKTAEQMWFISIPFGEKLYIYYENEINAEKWSHVCRHPPDGGEQKMWRIPSRCLNSKVEMGLSALLD